MCYNDNVCDGRRAGRPPTAPESDARGLPSPRRTRIDDVFRIVHVWVNLAPRLQRRTAETTRLVDWENTQKRYYRRKGCYFDCFSSRKDIENEHGVQTFNPASAQLERQRRRHRTCGTAETCLAPRAGLSTSKCVLAGPGLFAVRADGTPAPVSLRKACVRNQLRWPHAQFACCPRCICHFWLTKACLHDFSLQWILHSGARAGLEVLLYKGTETIKLTHGPNSHVRSLPNNAGHLSRISPSLSP